ncbi:MAG: CAP domain-containing protein [Jatrophihabitans sp.]
MGPCDSMPWAVIVTPHGRRSCRTVRTPRIRAALLLGLMALLLAACAGTIDEYTPINSSSAVLHNLIANRPVTPTEQAAFHSSPGAGSHRPISPPAPGRRPSGAVFPSRSAAKSPANGAAPVTRSRPEHTVAPLVTNRPPAAPPQRPTSCGTPQPPRPGYVGSAAAEQAVFHAINTSRAGNGLAAMSRSATLDESALRHSTWEAASGQFSHEVTGEHPVGDRVHESGAGCRVEVGENLGLSSDYSTDGVNAALAIHRQMMAEGRPQAGQANHYSNIMSMTFHHVGVSVVLAGGSVWFTTDYSS